MQKLLIDTDPGQDIDDLLVIWFALKHPGLDIRAITTVTWPSPMRARLVKRLLRYLGREDVGVAAGMQIPLRRFSAEEMRRQRDLAMCMNHYCFAQPEDSRDEPSQDSAVDLIIRTVKSHPGELALACIGPLTNIATALRREPDIAPLIKYIALMGGEVAQLRREHNVAFDYTAADIVFTSGIPLSMGTWSVTREFTLSMADCQRFREAGAVGEAMAQAIEAWHPAQSWKPGPVMYDLFPIAHSIDPGYYTLKPMRVEVETLGSDATRGMTVALAGEPNMHVTTSARPDALRELLLGTLLRQ